MKHRMLMHLLGAIIASGALIEVSWTHGPSASALNAVVGFEQEVVNVSEGNVAVVCVTALFISDSLLSAITVNASLYNLSKPSLDTGRSRCLFVYSLALSLLSFRNSIIFL